MRGAGLRPSPLGLILVAQTIWIITYVPGAPSNYFQFARHFAWTGGNIGW